jgi:hypothetical protein
LPATEANVTDLDQLNPPRPDPAPFGLRRRTPSRRSMGRISKLYYDLQKRILVVQHLADVTNRRAMRSNGFAVTESHESGLEMTQGAKMWTPDRCIKYLSRSD